MGDWLRHIALNAKARTGFGPALVVWFLIALVALALALGFFCAAAFVGFAGEGDSLTRLPPAQLTHQRADKTHFAQADGVITADAPTVVNSICINWRRSRLGFFILNDWTPNNSRWQP